MSSEMYSDSTYYTGSGDHKLTEKTVNYVAWFKQMIHSAVIYKKSVQQLASS
jgi:hypothetical protein